MRRFVTRLAVAVSSIALVSSLGVAAPASATTSTPAPATRLSGPERIATAVQLSRHGWSASEVVVLARADDPADGLTGSALAGHVDGPLLITPREGLAPEVAAEIRRLGASRVLVLGGHAAISPAVESQLRALGVAVERVAGSNRYETAARVAARLAPARGGVAYVVADWPDALAVSARAARAAAAGRAEPILLSGPVLPVETRAALRSAGVATVVLVDGGRRLPAALESALREDGLRVERVAGASRYEVSRTLLAQDVARDPGAQPLLVATGARFPDGLGAGALAARVGGRLLLTAPDAGTADELSLLATHWNSISRTIVVGGDAAVPEDHVRTLLKRPAAPGGSKKGTAPVSGDTGTGDTGTGDTGTTTRSGLHFTPAEVALWRTRSTQGPYRAAGDAGRNTPGDWTRIRANADAFLASPASAVWGGPTQAPTSCVPQWADEPPAAGASRLRDAAFVALVTGDERYATAAKNQLLAQAKVANLDFSNRSRWCTGVLWDINPSFQVTHWLTKLLYAYDYLGPDRFTTAERTLLDGWFGDAARFWQYDMERSFNSAFVDRVAGDYRIAAHLTSSPGCGRVGYLGGPKTCTLHSYYNNRKASIVRFVALVGVHQRDAALKATGSRFVKEFLAYTVFPDGSLGEFDRWTATHPDLGWAYATQVVAPAVAIADAFARAGDPSLYTHTTSTGAFGTEGGAKNLRFAVRALTRYIDGGVDRYGTDDATKQGDPAYRIDGVHGTWASAHDVTLVQANTYYRDAAISAAYTRTGAGTRPYPAAPASFGADPIWSGEAGTLPGVLFMFGGTEGVVSPYPG